jgi:hypothetical protein
MPLKTMARRAALVAATGLAAVVPAAEAAAATITFRTPAQGATVSGTLSGERCLAGISGTSGAISIKFFIDGRHFNSESLAPYDCSLDTRTLSEGTHTLRADLVDARGAKATTTRTITVRNAVERPNAAPQVAFRAPGAGQTVSGVLAGAGLEATATDDRKVVRVDFAVDGRATGSDSAAPYTATLDTRAVADGKRTLTATAVDDAGAKAVATRTVTVANVSQPSPPAPAPPTPAPTAPALPPAGLDATSGAIWTMNMDSMPLGRLGAGSPWGAQNFFAPDRIAVATDPHGRFGKVMRTETRPGEFIGGDANGSRLRAEGFMPMVGGKQWVAHRGDDVFYGFRFMETASNGSPHSITQFKGMNPDSNAYGGFLATDATHGFHLRFGGARIWQPSLGGLAAIRNRWYDVVIRVRYDTGTNGLVELWFGPAGSPTKQTLLGASGKAVGTTYRGATVFGDNAAAGTGGVLSKDIWLKQGIYGANAVATDFYSKTRIGKSFAEVVPR